MYGEEHYESKLKRNQNVVDKAPESVKPEVLQHIRWAIELIKRLDQLDYDQREIAINHIHKVLDEDYVKMGFTIEPKMPSKR